MMARLTIAPIYAMYMQKGMPVFMFIISPIKASLLQETKA